MSKPAVELITVMVVDDHAVVRNGLRHLLESDGGFVVTHLAADGAEALEAAGAAPPDVTLMDLAMPGMDGVETTRRLKTAHPEVRVVVLTSLGERTQIVEALRAGADGYLFKHAEPSEIAEAIRSAHRGEAVLDPKAARAMLDSQHTPSPGRPTLTAREAEVLRLVTEGLANKQIGRRLGISERTVKAHLTRVYHAIGVTDRTQAALWARDHLG